MMATLLSLKDDPYVLAYRYKEYMQAKPKGLREKPNPYYESLLANQPYPDEDATDPRSRAIRFAKEHYECFYETKHINMIVHIIDKEEVR